MAKSAVPVEICNTSVRLPKHPQDLVEPTHHRPSRYNAKFVASQAIVLATTKSLFDTRQTTATAISIPPAIQSTGLNGMVKTGSDKCSDADEPLETNFAKDAANSRTITNHLYVRNIRSFLLTNNSWKFWCLIFFVKHNAIKAPPSTWRGNTAKSPCSFLTASCCQPKNNPTLKLPKVPKAGKAYYLLKG